MEKIQILGCFYSNSLNKHQKIKIDFKGKKQTNNKC